MILAIYCAGGLGREMIEFARSINRWENIIFVDDIAYGTYCSGTQVYCFDEMEKYRGNIEFIIANGEPSIREYLYNKLKDNKYPLTTLISPSCSILSGTTIGEGCIIYDCGISTGVRISPNVYINDKVVIGHDVQVGSNSVISVGCFIGGGTKIGDRVYIAPGGLIKNFIKIGNDAIISLGAVIFRRVKQDAIMVGNPAKCIGLNYEKKVFGQFE